MFWEREVSRRKLLKIGVLGGTGITIGLALGCNKEETISEEFSLNDTIINSRNLSEIEALIKEKATRFPIYNISVDELPKNSPNSKTQYFLDYGQVGKKDLTKYGLRMFSPAQNEDSGNISVVLLTTENVRLGKFFQQANTPWPTLIFFTNESSYDPVIPPSFYEPFINSRNELVGAFWADFPIQPRDLVGKKFIIHFNARLFNVGGEDLPSFSLPYRFLIEDPPIMPKKPKGV